MVAALGLPLDDPEQVESQSGRRLSAWRRSSSSSRCRTTPSRPLSSRPIRPRHDRLDPPSPPTASPAPSARRGHRPRGRADSSTSPPSPPGMDCCARLYRRHRRSRASEGGGDRPARAAGEDLPPLAGAPFAAKNLFDIAGLATRAGSKINRSHAPARMTRRLVVPDGSGGRGPAWWPEHGRICLRLHRPQRA